MSIIRKAHIFSAALLATTMSSFAAAPAAAKTILFVGNSFTFGAHSPVQAYHPDRVTDLNRDGIGGVPAIFATFARESKLDWTVSLETSPGKDLAFHRDNKKLVFERSWDVVILQGHSMLDPKAPGDPARHVAAAHDLAKFLVEANPSVSINLVSTWPRADQVYKPNGRWFGNDIFKMSADLEKANIDAVENDKHISGEIPVGAAWCRAISDGLADPNPYDGIEYGKVNLWTYDQYHASAEGYYLEALMIFGRVTGVDPRSLTDKEESAKDLGIDPRAVSALQKIAAAELASSHPI